jgi:hypothetical protein
MHHRPLNFSRRVILVHEHSKRVIVIPKLTACSFGWWLIAGAGLF